jgi:hypothetical protein
MVVRIAAQAAETSIAFATAADACTLGNGVAAKRAEVLLP